MIPANLHPLAVVGPAEYASGFPSATSLAGYCKTTYKILVATLGLPHNHDINGKVNVEWAFKCANGTTFHVYDWEEPNIPSEEYWWHIGGNSAFSLKAFSRHTGLPVTRDRS